MAGKAKAAKSFLDNGLDNILKNAKDGEWIGAAAKGIAVAGTIGGVSEWSQGGSFFAGAKSNVLSGAALGMAGRAGNIAINGENWRNATMKSTYDTARGKKAPGTTAKHAAQGGVSKQLITLQKNEDLQKTAKQTMNNGSINKKRMLGYSSPSGPTQYVGPNPSVIYAGGPIATPYAAPPRNVHRKTGRYKNQK